jgi:hypothetical protein
MGRYPQTFARGNIECGKSMGERILRRSLLHVPEECTPGVKGPSRERGSTAAYFRQAAVWAHPSNDPWL